MPTSPTRLPAARSRSSPNATTAFLRGAVRVTVPDSRAALATLAARFHGEPARSLHLIGFTGTFGKTSTSDILRALLAAAGGRPGVLGSLGARFQSFHEDGRGLTTPAPVELHGALRGLAGAGADTVIMEVTSHALRMRRVDGLTFGGGLLAAIKPGEHTDFHRSYEDYLDAKRLFLRYLSPDAMLAYDADNPGACELAAARAQRPIDRVLARRCEPPTWCSTTCASMRRARDSPSPGRSSRDIIRCTARSSAPAISETPRSR